MKNIFKIAFAYVAALVGAGFASGQEIISFFVKYGKISAVGVILSAILFGIFAVVVLCGCIELKTVCYAEYLESIMPKPFVRYTEIITFLYGISVFCVMASCFGEMGYVLWGIENFKGVIFLCIMCTVLMILGTDRVMDFNAMLGSIIIIGIVSCSIYVLAYREHQTFSNISRMALSSISYSGYNLITAGSVLAPMSKNIKSRFEAWMVGIISAAAMFMMMILIWAIMGIYYNKINMGEIPMLTMVMRQNKPLTVIYSLMLWAALISTAISNGICCVNILCSSISRGMAIVVVTVMGLCLSGVGFSALINVAYRICGYAGIVVIVYLYFNFIKKGRKSKK